MSFPRVVRWVFWILLFALAVGASAALSSWYVTRQLARVIQAKQANPPAEAALANEPTVEVDFYEATGIRPEQLRRFLSDSDQEAHGGHHLVLLTLQDEQSNYLAESQVIVRWDTGEHRLLVGKSGIIQFPLTEQKLAGLRVIAPAKFPILRQRSFPLGNAYDAEQKPETLGFPFAVNDDGRMHAAINRGLARLQAAGEVLDGEAFQMQLRRRACSLELAPQSDRDLTAEEVYRLRRDAVVVVVHQGPDGKTTLAAGVVLDPSGVIATNYHVVDKRGPVARGVVTSDAQMYPVTEVLAADQPGDVALLRIAATGLVAAPLGEPAPVGAALTLISHPNSCYFSLTRGHVTRYWATTSYGRVSLRMGITCEFATGSSGAPLFDSRGNVVGIVSGTENVSYQMVHRSAIPTETLRRLIRPSAAGPE